MFYPLGKKLRETLSMGGSIRPPPPPPHVRPRVKITKKYWKKKKSIVVVFAIHGMKEDVLLAITVLYLMDSGILKQ